MSRVLTWILFIYFVTTVWKVKVVQSCPTVCDPCIVHGILQARILERVAFPSLGDLPNPGIKAMTPTSQADSLPTEPQGKPNVEKKIKSLARSLPLGKIKSVWATPTFRKPALENKTKLLIMGKTFSFRTNSLFRCVTRACVSFLFRKKNIRKNPHAGHSPLTKRPRHRYNP